MGNIEIVNWGDITSKSEWLKLRKKMSGLGESYVRVGASDIGTITGSNKWTSKRRLMLSLSDIYHKDWINPLVVLGGLMEGNVQSFWEGYVHGDLDQSLYNTRDGVRLRQLQQAEFFVLNDSVPHIFVSLDAVALEEYKSPISGRTVKGLIPHEFKYVGVDSYKSWGGQISPSYLEQVQIQMHMTKTDFCIFAPLLQNGDFYPIEVEYDKDLAEYLVNEAGKFCVDAMRVKLLKAQIELSTDEYEIHDLKNMITDIVPIDHTDDNLNVINETHIGNIDELKLKVEENSEEELLMEQYLLFKEDEKEVKRNLNEVKSRLILASDGFEGIDSPRFRAVIRGNNSYKSSYFKVTQK